MDLVISHVYKDFGRGPVLRDVSLTVRQGETVCLMGPSGLGKTTLLRCVAGLERPESGSITGVPERLGYVFQEDRLLDGLTATANIRAPHGRMRGAELAAFLARERAALASVGLPVDARPVRELSGGQRRRVSILRCALADADALFFDEPLKGMDDATVGRVMAFLLPEMEGRTVFWVTHDERELAWFPRAERWHVAGGTARR